MKRRLTAIITAGLLAGSSAVVAAGPAAAAPAGDASPCPPQDPALTLPDPPDHGVAQAQVFDRQVPDPSVYQGRVNFVWGANRSEQPPGVVASSYVTAFRNAPQRQFTYDWFLQNHPSWIEYTADRTTPAWEFGNHVYTPLDIGNPEVREWYFDNLIAPAVAAGFKVIAVDNIGLHNDFFMSGHYDAGGNWVRQFTDDPNDPNYASYVNDWLTYLKNRLHAQGVAVAFNITFNASLHDQFQDKSPELIAAMSKAIETSDIWLNEQGFTVHRVENVNDDEWLMMFDLVRKFKCKLMVMDNKLPTPTWGEASPEQRQWVVANYFLYREQPTMMVMTGLKDYAQFNEIPELEADLGTATTPPIGRGTGLWTRSYAHGMTVVNPSSTGSASLRLPAGTWTDLHGVPYSGQVTVPPNTGLVLTAG